MKKGNIPKGPKGLVAVFKDIETARGVIQKLFDAGFPSNVIELVTHDVKSESPRLETPPVHETTASMMVDGAGLGARAGAGTGLLAGLLTGNPVLALGMTAIGGVTGAIVGGMAGIDQAIEDDSVNLPTLSEYEQMVRDGHCLVVVLGQHDDVMKAEVVMKEYPDIHHHLHPLHGHEYHEHPASGDQVDVEPGNRIGQ